MDTPSYYAILPANVRYDKSLKPMARIMYAEITALSGKTGKCWASNEYFANLYDVDDKTVSRWIASLINRGYVKRTNDNSGRRGLTINTCCCHENASTEKPPSDKKVTPKAVPGDELITHNIKEINNKDSLGEEEIPLPLENDVDLPDKKEIDVIGHAPEETLYTQVKKAFEHVYGKFEPGIYGKEGAAIKQLIKKAEARQPNDPGYFLKELMRAFYSLKQSGDRFYSKQPFLPSALNSGGIYSRVLETLREQEEMPDCVKKRIAECYA